MLRECGWMPIKTIVCLANSYKPPHGRCIAGREIIERGYGGWIRPVSVRDTKELSYTEYRYEDGQTPQLLDVIEIPILREEPLHHQTENHLIEEGKWVRKDALRWNQLEALLDRPASLWIDSDSTSQGVYDRISQEEAATVQNSLFLIKPEKFNVAVTTNYWTSKRNIRATFTYNGTHHNLSVTDPVARDIFGSKELGNYPLHGVYLCVSLTEPYEHDDKCHKLVAAIITEHPLG